MVALARRDNGDRGVAADREEVRVAGHEQVGATGKGGADHRKIIGVATCPRNDPFGFDHYRVLPNEGDDLLRPAARHPELAFEVPAKLAEDVNRR